MGVIMRISCASLFLWEYDIYDIMEILLDAGIESVEFWAETPDFWMNRNDEIVTAGLVEAISMMPGGCTVHAPIMDLNPSSYNDLVHEAAIKETLWSLGLAKTLEARVVTIHPGKRTARRTPTNEDWDKFRRYLNICKNRADELGINLSLENSMRDVSSMCSVPGEMEKILNEFPGLFLTYDVVHAFMDSPKTAFSFIDRLGDRIINVHVGAPHDGKPHYPSHRVRKNMDAVLRKLKGSGYNGDLTIEIDDKIYPGSLTRNDKVGELVEERKYLESIFEI